MISKSRVISENAVIRNCAPRKIRIFMANTKSIEDKAERKKVKRTARKKAAPKAARTQPRGENKKKVKKLSRGQSKR
ncbi:MAG: hypothetical protein WA634_13965 [Silvibacterium sp.]